MALSSGQFRDAALAELDGLYRFALALARSPQDADDLVQETFLRAVKYWKQHEDRGSGLRPWLFGILRNRFLTFKDKRKSAVALINDDQLDALPAATDFNAEIDWSTLDDRIVAALEELPEGHRTVMLLWAVEEFTYQQIADTLEVPIGTVMSRLHRSKARMAESLRPVAQEKRLIRE